MSLTEDEIRDVMAAIPPTVHVDQVAIIVAELVEHKERIRALEAEVADLAIRLRGAEGQVRDLKHKLAARSQGADDA